MKRLLFFVLLAAFLASVAVWRMLSEPYAAFTQTVLVDIPPRTPSSAIGALLERNGVIRDRRLFFLARLLDPSARLQAGEYLFAAPNNVLGVYSRIARGDVHYYEFTVPEGSNLFDVAEIVAGLGFISEADFRRSASDPALIQDLAPEAASLEGYLYPSTYRVTRRNTAEQICRIMTSEFRKRWKELASTRPVHETVTLASLVEKETGRNEERKLVSSVFHNRLAKGIKLECDPTTIYAALLENRYRGTIYRSDLDSRHLYNTYQHAGLPPGPIANPGKESLVAALQPADTSYIFFVAKGDGSGGHNFSTTHAQHSRAVAEYRRAQSNRSTGQ
jgi:UPF0755 protein